MAKVKIFVDFWNFQLSVNELANDKNFRLDYSKLSKWLIDQARCLIDEPLIYQGLNLYLSFDPENTNDGKFQKWAHEFLGHLPGFNIHSHQRSRKGQPFCGKCHRLVEYCPNCNSPLSKTMEKGVDTALVTDLLGLAWSQAWDVAILISSDRDFIPAVKMLQEKGLIIVNGCFPPRGAELSGACWAHFDMHSIVSDIRLIK